jgi:hypothetical protein
MKKIEIQMLLYTLVKKLLSSENMLNPCTIILFCKVVQWFDGQDIGVKPKIPTFNPPYQHILYEVYIFKYILYTCV